MREHACERARVCVNAARCEADWRPDCHGFALQVQYHSNVEIGHEIFSTVIPIPYSKEGNYRYWRNLCRPNNQQLITGRI